MPPAPNYDDPEVEEAWLTERRIEVASYLDKERVKCGRIGDWPAWHVAPFISIWAIESARFPGSVGWWVICGDLPTDYISASTAKNPRDALREIIPRWSKLTEGMARGDLQGEMTIGDPDSWPALAPLLKSRTQFLAKMAEDDSVWEN